ncbi:MBL fold metallo-hydrolase [Actinoplanes sp. NPDC051851]|uniref:MBL fold metallo-hydrolase n=1 Tax=Actinoplanes sp. NPDC051851 TaxID=3154753 RepID=UPI00343C59C4
MKLTYLGTCGNQTADREATGFVVQEGETVLLVDAGPGATRQVYRTELPCAAVENIVITHAHGDHASGLPYLLWSSFYDRLAGTTGPDTVKIYALEGILQGLQSTLRFYYDPARWPFTIDWLPVPIGQKFDIGSLRVTAVEVQHSVPNIGLRIENGETVVSYSSDTVHCPAFVELARGSDLMVHEGFCRTALADLAGRTGHSTAAEAGRAARESGAKRLHLVHQFPSEYPHLATLIREASAEYEGPVTVPVDLDVVEV